MYHKNCFIMLRLFEKKRLLVMQKPNIFIGDQSAGHGDRMAESWSSWRPCFAGLGGYSLDQESLEVIFGAHGGHGPFLFS